MRICDLTNLYIDEGEGGVNTYLREKVAYFEQREESARHILIVPAARSEVRRLGSSTLYAVASPRYRRNPQHRVIFNRRAVAKILLEERPDVVEVDCASFLGQIALRALRPHRPALVGFYHVHLPTFFARPWGNQWGRVAASMSEGIAWRYLKCCVGSCDRVVVSSEDMRARLETRGLVGLEHIPLGVNTELFRPLPGPEAAAHSARTGPYTILYVGRLSHEKDLPLLFSAFERLEGERRGAYRLKIVGDGPLRPLAEKFAREHDNAEYCGLCPYGAHLAEHYRTSDVVALPSPNETFGLAILEALASGVPVVAARRGGPAGLLSAGLGGLSEPGNAADMAAKIEQAIHHRHQGSQYRDYVVRHFSWSRTFDRLLQLYGELLEARRATSRTRCRTPVDSA